MKHFLFWLNVSAGSCAVFVGAVAANPGLVVLGLVNYAMAVWVITS